MVRGGELFLIGASIAPLPTVSTHFVPDPTRTRKLLLNAEEIKRLIGKVEQRGYTLMPLNLHYTKGRIKLEIGLARASTSTTSGRGAREGLAARKAAVATQPLISCRCVWRRRLPRAPARSTPPCPG